MPRLRISISLPYLLRLRGSEYPPQFPSKEEREYKARPDGWSIQLQLLGQTLIDPERPTGFRSRMVTQISAEFEASATDDRDKQFKHRARAAERLLADTNRLMRWYRAASQQAEIVELTRAQASPFFFDVLDGTDPTGWTDNITFESDGPRALQVPTADLTAAVRAGFESGGEPEVADLCLLDAERAVHEGRFREAIFCWSTIDAVFNRKYDQLVNAALAGEWKGALDFFTGVDFGLKNKMSAVMHLVANRSFFREPDNFWASLTTSYQKRNDIIHRGETASEDDARRAIDVACRVVTIMKGL